MTYTIKGQFAATLLLLSSTGLMAGEADVTDVKVSCSSSCRFDVSLRHADTGWEHYADRWDVVAPDGEVLGTRVLLHPHVNEQPFTRSLSGVVIPSGVSHVMLRARDSKHGWGGREMQVQIPAR